MGQKIERDQQRFRKLVRGKVKSNLSKYISRGEMIGQKGKDLVSIPCRRSRSRSFASVARAPAALAKAKATSARHWARHNPEMAIRALVANRAGTSSKSS